MKRYCPECGAELTPLMLRCSCGFEFPEAHDARSTPEQPRCCVCAAAMKLMAECCPSCGAVGYPALRSRRSKKSLGSPHLPPHVGGPEGRGSHGSQEAHPDA